MYRLSPSGNWFEYIVIRYIGKKKTGTSIAAAIRTAILLPQPKGRSKNRVSLTRKLSDINEAPEIGTLAIFTSRDNEAGLNSSPALPIACVLHGTFPH